MYNNQPEKFTATAFNFCHRTAIGQGASTYLPLAGGTQQPSSTGETSILISRSGTLKNLFWDCKSNSLTGSGNIFTVQFALEHVSPANALALGNNISVSLDGKITNGTGVLSLNVSAGQRIAILVQTASGGPSTNIVNLRVSFELESDLPQPNPWNLSGTNLSYTGGNVGINSINPSEKLDVSGSVKIVDGTQGAGKVFTSDNNGKGSWVTPNNLPNGTNGQTLRHDGTNWKADSNLFNDGTRVGIGTLTPQYYFEVHHPDSTSTIAVTTSQSNGYAQFIMTNPDSIWAMGFVDGGLSDWRLANYSTGVRVLTATTTGRLGIGVQIPRAKLDVDGDINISGGSTIKIDCEDILVVKQNNTFIGLQAGYNNGHHLSNSGFGDRALADNMGDENSAFGCSPLQFNKTGIQNCAFGNSTLLQNTDGSGNTAMGYQSGMKNASGNNNTYIGINSRTTGNYDNSTAIGANSIVEQSNSLVLGDLNVNVGIGITKPQDKLHVEGSINIGTSCAYKIDGSRVLVKSGQNLLLGDANTNVGIGSTDPREKITLGSDSNIAIEMSPPSTSIITGHHAIGYLTEGDVYYFRVAASDGTGWTRASDPVSFIVDVYKTIRIGWNAIPGAMNYRLFKSSSPSGPYSFVDVPSGSGPSAGYEFMNEAQFTITSFPPPEENTAYVNKLSASGNSWLMGGNLGIGTSAPTSQLQVVGLPVYTNNLAARNAGLSQGAFYRTGGDPDLVCVVH